MTDLIAKLDKRLTGPNPVAYHKLTPEEWQELRALLVVEDGPTFCARIIAERDALRERVERAPCGYVAISLATDFVMVSEIDAIRVQKIALGKRVALVVVEE